jgi:pSer/pThr/pTyr-binding forkhead associated (FHA) protein
MRIGTALCGDCVMQQWTVACHTTASCAGSTSRFMREISGPGSARHRPDTRPLPDRSRPVLIVGRRADCDVVLSDTTVSRVHAVLMLFGGEWLIHDRQSTNGTRVNGRRVWGATAVKPGDRISFGGLTLRLAPPAAGERDSTL